MLTLHVEAETASELVKKALASLNIQITAAAPAPAKAPEVTPEVAPAPAPAAEPATPAPKRGRPKKAVSTEQPPQVASTVEQTAAADSPTPQPAAAVEQSAGAPATTMDDVRKAAQQVVEKIGGDAGMAAARKVLIEKAGVKVLRDVPADKMAAVHEGLTALLNAKS